MKPATVISKKRGDEPEIHYLIGPQRASREEAEVDLARFLRVRSAPSREELVAELEGLRRAHHVSPDCWYTCPAMNRNPEYEPGERCCNDRAERGDTTCDCGADEHNAKLDTLIAAIREMP
jgi:hypothetical protein